MKDKTILFFSVLRWDSLYQRNHHLAKRLAAHNRVYFIEPTYSFLALGRNNNLRYLFKNSHRLRNVDAGVTAVPGPLVLPFRNVSIIVNHINQWLLTRNTRQLLSGKPINDLVLWTTFPNEYKQLGRWSETMSVYDCFDEHSEWMGPSKSSKVAGMEAELFKHADLVFASSALLAEKAKKFRNEAIYLPNAVSESVFEPREQEIELEPGLLTAMRNKRQIIGYIGALSYWLDYELINSCIKALPQALFVFVGPRDCPEAESLGDYENVLITGAKEYTEVPAYIETFDVCTIPFKVNKLTERVNPIKVYEYLSKGKTVVSVDLPELDDMQELIKIGRDGEHYLHELSTALSEPVDNNIKETRIAYAKANTWSHRVTEIERNIDRFPEDATTKAK